MSAERSCPNCSTPHHPDDVFCENCGYDFLTGSPAEEPGAGHETEFGARHESAGQEAARVFVTVDLDHYVEMDPDGQLDYPDPEPEPAVVDLPPVALIGRSSQSRGVFPEIDVGTITGDRAASHRHAMLRRRDDGSWVVSDLSSTNGSLVRLDDSTEPLAPGVEVVLTSGATILVGAWTAITLDLG